MEIIQEFGKIAGIAGLGLGVFLFLFKDLIAKNIFPNMTQEQGYKIIRLFMFLVWSIAIIGIFSWLFLEYKKKPEISPTVPAEIKKDTTDVNQNKELPSTKNQPQKEMPQIKQKKIPNETPTEVQTNTISIGRDNNGNVQQNNNKGDVNTSFSTPNPIKKDEND